MKMTHSLLAAAFIASFGTAQAELVASLSPGTMLARGMSTDSVLVTLTNTGKAPLYVLKWNTPLFELTEDLFRVSYQGEEFPTPANWSSAPFQQPKTMC